MHAAVLTGGYSKRPEPPKGFRLPIQNFEEIHFEEDDAAITTILDKLRKHLW